MRTSIRGLSAATALAGILAYAAPALASEGPVEEVTYAADVEAEPAATPLIRASVPVEPASSNSIGGESGLTVSGSATLATDYRFRGVSQTDNNGAVQGGFSISHTSGVYVGAWASNLAGWGTFGGSNTELDLYAGFKFPIGEGTLDVGGTWFMYPGGADTTDFAELYAKLSGTIGPLSLTGSVFYAPSQEALGNVFATGAAAAAGIPTDPGDSEDNLYLAADAAFGVSGTPITLTAHLGYSDGNPGLGPNGTSVAPTGTYFDWSLGASVVLIEGLTLSAAYVDTDISDADAAVLLPNFSALDGDSISDATVVVSLTASF